LNTRSSSRLYDRNFFLALVCQTCFVAANTLMAHYARWIEFLGGDLGQVGMVMGAGATVGLVLRPWMAQWINRLGARMMWAIGLGVFGAGSIANLTLVEIGPMIYVVRSSLVLGAAIVFASGLTYITQSTPQHRRTEAIGIFGIGGFMGMLIGPFIGDLFLADRDRGNFALLFCVAAMANLLPAIGMYFLRPTTSERTNSSVRLKDFVLTTRRHWPGTILLVDLAFGVCMAGPFVFVASFIDQASLQIEGVSIIGLFFLFYASTGIVLRLTLRRLPERIGSRKVLLAGMLFMSAGMFSFAIVDAANTWLMIVPALLTGAGHGLMFHTMTSLTLENYPLAVRGSGSALALMMLDLGTIFGAPVLGMIGERFGFSMLFSAIGCFTLVVAATYTASCASAFDINQDTEAAL
jgi:MFS family permease